MTAPTSMSVMPAVARSNGPTGSSSAVADGGPAFASALDSALDDALTGGGNATGSTPDGDAEQPDATGTGDTVPVVLVPGLWALMTAVTPLTAAATGTAATTAAASLIGAVTGTPVPPAAGAPTAAGAPAAALPGAALPGAAPDPAAQPALPAAPDLTATPAATGPAPVDPATTATLALAEGAGLSLVVDAAPAAPTGTPSTLVTDPAATVAAPLLPPVGATGSADTGSDGATGGTAPSAPAVEEAPPAADTDSVFTLGGTTQTTAAGPATEVPQSPAGLDDAPVATQLGRQIAVLRNAPDGSQTMTLVITPESLGPVTIAVTITDGTLDLTLQGSSEHGRHALLDALPDLRRDLEGAGLSFSKLEVGASSDAGSGARAAQQQLLDARAGQPGSSGQGSSGQPGQQAPRTWGSVPDAAAADGTPLTTNLSTSAGVDVRV